MIDSRELSANELGRRIRLVRESANRRVEEAAAVIGLTRGDIESIERGTRSVRINELQSLARYFGTTVDAIMRRTAIHVNLVPRFRRLKDSQSEAVIEAAKLLNNLVRAEVELESILGIKRAAKYPDEKAIDVGDEKILAEQHAQQLRIWLNIGSRPIADIFSLIEFDIGIRLFQRRLEPSISGLFVYDESVGACILLNACHPFRHRVCSAAHEIGHFMGTRDSPETYEKGESFESREERYADYFSRSFLAPSESFEAFYNEISEGDEPISSRKVILLAHQFGVSREFSVRRLEQLGLVKRGTWDWFVDNATITTDLEKKVLGNAFIEIDDAIEDSQQPVPHRIGLMAWKAWDEDLLTESQLAELLNMNRFDFRKMIHEKKLEDGATDEIFKFSK